MGSPPPGTAWWRSRQLRLAVSAAMVVFGIASFLIARSGSARASGEIFLESADTAGPDTFTPSVAEPPPAQKAATATTSPAPSSGGLVRAQGSSPGLYGGTRDAPSCNAERLVNYLEANPDRARPWAQASGVKVTDIRAYVATLTPALTRVDARVTDFALAGNRVAPRQAVLEAGTAVFLDRRAAPRVRCASGNPLGEAQAVSSTPRYQGPRWPRFSPPTTVVIAPALTPIDLVTLLDILSGLPFGRIPGSIVIIDIDRPPAATTLAVVEPGGRARISGTNWPPGTPVTITFDNPAVDLGTATADTGGGFSTEVPVPRSASVGVHQVNIAGGGFATTQPVYVVPPRVPQARVRAA